MYPIPYLPEPIPHIPTSPESTEIPTVQTTPMSAEPYQMPRMYHSSLTGIPYDVPDSLGLLPGEMAVLYPLWDLWS